MNGRIATAMLAVFVATTASAFGADRDAQPGAGAVRDEGTMALPGRDSGDVLVAQGNEMGLASTAWSARTLIGASVVDQDGKKLGSIDDLVLDRDNKVTKLIIANGSVFGLGGKTVATAYDGAAITREQDHDRAPRLRINKDTLDQSAEIDKTKVGGDSERLASSYLDRNVRLAGGDAGADNTHGDKTGEVQDLLMNHDGLVKYAVIDFSGFLGRGSDQVVVRFGALAAAPKDRPMTLAMTELELKAAPKFQRAGGILGTGGK